MQTIKQKRAAYAARTRWHGNRVGYFGISRQEYVALAKSCNAAEKLGTETTGVGKGPFRVGCLLRLSGGNHDYELLVDGTGYMQLGRVQQNGQRVRLYAGGTNTEAPWGMLLQALRKSEGRLPA
jgi:hypothetical protein